MKLKLMNSLVDRMLAIPTELWERTTMSYYADYLYQEGDKFFALRISPCLVAMCGEVEKRERSKYYKEIAFHRVGSFFCFNEEKRTLQKKLRLLSEKLQSLPPLPVPVTLSEEEFLLSFITSKNKEESNEIKTDE